MPQLANEGATTLERKNMVAHEKFRTCMRVERRMRRGDGEVIQVDSVQCLYRWRRKGQGGRMGDRKRKGRAVDI